MLVCESVSESVNLWSIEVLTHLKMQKDSDMVKNNIACNSISGIVVVGLLVSYYLDCID